MRRFLARVIPFAALVVLAVLVVLALAGSPPPVASFAEPPDVAPLAPPDLRLGTATLAGVVVDGAGRPIADAGLLVVDAGRLAWTWTDIEGRFVLTEVPATTLDVALVARGFEPARVSANPGPTPARLVMGRRIDTAPDLPSLAALDVAGRVAFTSLESAEAGYELAFLPVLGLERIDSGLPRRTRVEADGSYRIAGLAPGEYEVHLLPPEARGGVWPNLLVGADAAAPRHEQPAPGGGVTEGEHDPVRLDLRSRAGCLAGRLSDRRRAGGASWLGGAVVRVEPLDVDGRHDPVRVLWTVSDAEGGWTVRHLPAGRYRVSLAAGAERRERNVVVRERARVDPDL